MMDDYDDEVVENIFYSRYKIYKELKIILLYSGHYAG